MHSERADQGTFDLLFPDDISAVNTNIADGQEKKGVG